MDGPVRKALNFTIKLTCNVGCLMSVMLCM